MVPSYEFFDHTADMGVRVRAPTMSELVGPAVEGFYAAIGEVVAGEDPTPFVIALDGEEPALLLRDLLTELLVLFERERRRLKSLDRTHLSARRLLASGTAAGVDLARSVLQREVKAVTYHELSIHPVPGGYEATFIVDI